MTRLLLLTAALCAPAASAQTPRPMLDYASAAKIREGCLAWAQAHGGKVAVAIMDSRGMLVAYAHMDGVSEGAGDIARWKANSSAKFGRATADTAKLNPPANTPNVSTIGGGVPIYTPDGAPLGGVGTSGGKPEDDAACGTAGIEAAGLKAEKPAAPPAQ